MAAPAPRGYTQESRGLAPGTCLTRALCQSDQTAWALTTWGLPSSGKWGWGAGCLGSPSSRVQGQSPDTWFFLAWCPWHPGSLDLLLELGSPWRCPGW